MNSSIEEKSELRKKFLLDFMQSMLSQVKPSLVEETEEEIETQQENFEEDYSQNEKSNQASPQPQNITQLNQQTFLPSDEIKQSLSQNKLTGPLQKTNRENPLPPLPSFSLEEKIPLPPPLQLDRPGPSVQPALQIPKVPAAPQVKTPVIPAPPNSVDLGKLNFLLMDPAVQAIECQGPNKNILVRKNGVTQKTPVILQEDEIKKIVDNFSKKTKIPLIGNMFKAAYSNLIMSAVSSEFLGTRFIVQKKFNPAESMQIPKPY